MNRNILRLICSAGCLVQCAATVAARKVHPTAVTIVVRPWAEASIDGGKSLTVPSTVLLDIGEHKLIITRRGYRPISQTLRIENHEPQHYLFVMERQ